MINRLYFNAREWNFNKECETNVGERCFINGIDGKLVEIYSIGNWNWQNWTEILSKPMLLEKNTDYSFCFWLNGGENDRSDEVCQLRVIFDKDYDNLMRYKLNRGYIKPLKKYKGWELYDITFNTGDRDYNFVQLSFVAQTAYMAIQPAKAPEEYADLENVVDEFEDMRPQRHNIIFEDGWPATGWYSTNELRKKKEAEQKGAESKKGFSFNFEKGFGKDFGKDIGKKFGKVFGDKSDDTVFSTFNTDFSQSSDNGPNPKNKSDIHINGQSISDLIKELEERLREELRIEDIVNSIKEEIDIEEIVESIKDEIDIDEIKEEIKESIHKEI